MFWLITSRKGARETWARWQRNLQFAATRQLAWITAGTGADTAICALRGDRHDREHAGRAELPPDQAARPLHAAPRGRLSVPLDLPGFTQNR